jgi:hypothetical protein
VRSDVLGGLNRDLQRVGGKSFLANVDRNALRLAQIAQLAHTGLDESEFFLDEVDVGHRRGCRAACRYSRKYGSRSKYALRA